MTLKRFMRNGGVAGYQKVRNLHRVFTTEQKNTLAARIKQLDNRFYGLSTEKWRK